jgi:hypothetical protein
MDNGWSLSLAWQYIVSSPVVAFKDTVTALILAIIIIVVAVPEGLPMMIAIVLSLNMRRLLHAKVSRWTIGERGDGRWKGRGERVDGRGGEREEGSGERGEGRGERDSDRDRDREG